ncbi:hypothetical protein AB3N02_13810 [Priestia aryabhattai]|uniref:hypothetical protein n=1 Tax=Priestia aryabhattai TaxID=412384 RepID=UPI0039A39FF1
MRTFQTRTKAQPPLFRLEPFRGLNISVTPTQIDDHESPDMLNMNIDERGALNKRTGYERMFNMSLGNGEVKGMFLFRKPNYTADLLFVHGSTLYAQQFTSELPSDQPSKWLDDDLNATWESDDLTDSWDIELYTDKIAPTALYTGLTGENVNFFVMGGICYMMDGVNYISYDGTTVQNVTPYVPTTFISKTPDGSGTAFEDFNMIGAGFKETFSADGVAKIFKLALGSLDATPVTAVVNNVPLTEGSGFTVDRSTGIVTFTTTPSSGTNNVEITAYKSQPILKNKVLNCKFAVLYGGDNDTRVFISGNKDLPNYIFVSDTYRPTYFPENRFYKVGSDNEKVQGFSKQYDYLVIEKELSKWMMNYTLTDLGVTFPIRPLNDQYGTIAPNTIQLVDNNPVSLSRHGVYMVTASNVRDEKNVTHISAAVDNKLLNEPNLEKAVAVDFDRKYWLAVNGNVYVFDYDLKAWYIYDNIHASCMEVVGRQLYFASTTEGLIYRFMRDSDGYAYNDDGKPINAYWKSKYITFDADEMKKMVEKVFFSLKASARSSADLYYVTDKKYSPLIKTVETAGTLDFRFLDFTNFTFNTSVFPREASAKIKAKKITHFQLMFKNDRLNESMGIVSAGIKFRYQNFIK